MFCACIPVKVGSGWWIDWRLRLLNATGQLSMKKARTPQAESAYFCGLKLSFTALRLTGPNQQIIGGSEQAGIGVSRYGWCASTLAKIVALRAIWTRNGVQGMTVMRQSIVGLFRNETSGLHRKIFRFS